MDSNPAAALFSEWDAVIKYEDIVFEKALKSGNYGKVWKAKVRGQVVAVKVLSNQDLTTKKLEELQREVDIMRRLHHPRIMLLMGICTEPKKISLIMEFVEGRDLLDVIQDKGLDIPQMQRLKYAKEIAIGCNWLHCLSPPIIHRDLKAENVMITKEGNVKVCDFGLSCVKELDLTPRTRAIGTPIFMSPEVLQGVPSNEKSDVYAYALLLWEMWTRDQRPFSYVASIEEFFDDVIEKQVRPTIPKDVPADVADLIRRCWAHEPSERPSFDQVITDIDGIIINTLVNDTEGRKVWAKLKSAKDMNYPFEADNALLEKVLSDTYGWNDNKGFELLEFLVAEDYEDVTRSTKKKIAKLEKFGKFLEIFGPLDRSTLSRFVDVCRTGYFHGDISSATAADALAAAAPGTFLVRLSSKDTCLTLSKKVAVSSVNHQRISKEDGQFKILLPGGNLVTSATLPQLISQVAGPLGLDVKSSTTLPSKIMTILTATPVNSEYVSAELVQSLPLATGKSTKKEKKGKKEKEHKKKDPKKSKNK